MTAARLATHTVIAIGLAWTALAILAALGVAAGIHLADSEPGILPADPRDGDDTLWMVTTLDEQGRPDWERFRIVTGPALPDRPDAGGRR